MIGCGPAGTTITHCAAPLRTSVVTEVVSAWTRGADKAAARQAASAAPILRALGNRCFIAADSHPGHVVATLDRVRPTTQRLPVPRVCRALSRRAASPRFGQRIADAAPPAEKRAKRGSSPHQGRPPCAPWRPLKALLPQSGVADRSREQSSPMLRSAASIAPPPVQRRSLIGIRDLDFGFELRFGLTRNMPGKPDFLTPTDR